tara:strand:- start:1162 stop:1626 length:465 start_codon:yes stop_codon:yes gene_type:complete
MEKVLEFISNHTLLVVALMVSFFVVIFTELRRKASNLISIDISEAISLFNKDAIIIDLRNIETFSKGHIVNARNIPFDELEGKIETLESNKSQPIITVCEAGIMSTKAVNILQKLGFESVFSLKGGMNNWGQIGLPVVTGKKTKVKKSKKPQKI